MEPKEFLAFLARLEKLKCNTRHSWTSSGRHESVAEHSWRLAMLAMLLRDALPEVDIVKPEDLFKCDMFIFVASKGIPPVGSGVKDVRMYQFEANSAIVAGYARQARRENFKGLFAVVSDPVDPLAKTAYLESNKNEAGEFDGLGLRPRSLLCKER